MNIAPHSLDTDLSELLVQVNNGKMQLPDFQRPWTWDNDRIIGLIASLSQGYPMGAIMRLEYGNPEIKFKYRTIEGVEGVSVVPEYLVLDGQQRLTSMYRSIFSKNPVRTKNEKGKELDRYYYLDINKCLDSDCDRFEAILSVPADKKIKKNFDRDIELDLSTRELEYEHEMFPLNIVFDGSEREDWSDGYKEYWEHTHEIKNKYKTFRNDVLETIKNYKLPVITLDRNTPREAVCKVFENVNTGGVALTVFELVTATFATHDEFELRKDWERCRDTFRGVGETLMTDILHGIDETTFLTAVTLYTSYVNKLAGKGATSCKKKDVLALDYNDYINNRDKVTEGFIIARNFLLQHQCVFRQRDLPYTTQLIPLAAICAYLGKNKCNEPNTVKILSRWYWCGIFGEMYGGANETRYAQDIEDVIDDITEGTNNIRTINAAFFSSTRLLSLQTRNSAAYKGIMALLYKEKCRDFMKNISIDIVNSMIESPDIHHIFPEEYCEKQGIKRQKYNSVVNKTPLLPETNRSIGGYAPSEYIKNITDKVSGLDDSELRSRIESHFIDYGYLAANDFDSYFVDRAKKLLKLIEKAMGKSVADKDAELTVQQFGVSLVD